MRRLPVCALIAMLLLAGCKTQLYTSLDQRDAMDMVAILVQHGIGADRVFAKDGTSTIEVEQSRVADAVMLLRANRYPRTSYDNMGDIFQQKGLISSPTAERARYDYALSQELSRTLSDIDGVLTARVHIVLPNNDPLDGDGTPSAAAVFVRYDARVAMTRLLPQIKMLVADSVEGLTYDKVSVVLLPVRLPPTVALVPARHAGSAMPGPGWIVAATCLVATGGTLAWRQRWRWLGGRRPATTVAKLRRVA